MVNVSIDVTDLGGEARPGDKVVFWRPRMGGSATHAGRVISTAPVTVFLTDGKATVSDVEPGEMTVLLQCRGVESQGPVTVGVPDGGHTVTLRALLESQFEYAPPIVSAVQEAASNASASEEAAIQAQIRSEAAADRADAKVDDAINNGANLIRNEVKQDADRAVSARQAAAQSESNAAASEGAAASSASNAKTSETNAKQSETNAGDFAAVATTAATEAVDAMSSVSDIIGANYATHEYVDSKAWIKRAFTTGEDLNTVVGTGVHSFNTYKVSSSLLNTPSNWVPQPGWLEVFNSGQVIFQKLYVWDSNFISSWERVRLGPDWQPWTQTMYRGAPPTPPAPKTWAQTDDVIFWGDSLVDGGDTNGQWATGENLPGQLSTHLSNEVVNRGRSGQTSNEILIRSGAVEIWGTPVGGKTVPGGHVDIVVNGQTPLSRTGRTFAATWGGASGTLKSKGTGWEFYQPGGAAATITSSTKVNVTQAFPHENSAHIFLMGENDFWTGDLAPDGDIVDHVVANYQRAVESIPEDPVRHVLIGGVKCKADTVKGDERYRQVKEINRRLAALFPANFVDREAWLSSRALDAAGITPTESDLEAMAANITPPSAFASGDNLHIRKEVVSAEARELWLPALIHRGWAQAKDGVSVPAPFNTFSVDLWASRDDLDSKSDKGHVHTADQITDLHHYRGTGSPEGKVSAPVGSVYTDTAATNGAIRWIKTSGTGNTGWRDYADKTYVDAEITDLSNELDGRVKQEKVSPQQGTAWAHVSQTGHRLPLGYTQGGRLDAWAQKIFREDVGNIHEVDGDSRFAHAIATTDDKILLGIRRDGRIVAPGLLHWGAPGDMQVVGDNVAPVWPDMSRIVGWGSSTMQGLGTTLGAVSTGWGSAYVNEAKGGERAGHTAARLGSRPALVSFPGGEMPASGTVNIQVSNLEPSVQMKSYDVTISGVRGRISSTNTSWTFARSSLGDPVAVADDTPAIPIHPHLDAVTILNIGKNSFSHDNPGREAEIIEITDTAYAHLTPITKRVIVLGHFCDVNLWGPSRERDQIEIVRQHQKSRYGRQYVDMWEFVTGPEIWEYTGITPTPEDLANQEIGNLPPSVAFDNGHLNSAGYAAVTTLIQERMRSLGWY